MYFEQTGLTALMIAINHNQSIEVIERLIKAGANPNATNKVLFEISSSNYI